MCSNASCGGAGKKGIAMNKKRSLKLALVSVLLAVMMVLSTVVFAGSSDYSDNSTVQSYQQKIKDINSKLEAAKKKIKSINKDIDSASEYKTELDKLIEITTAKIETSEEYSKELSAEIERLDAEIVTMEEECANFYEQIKERMRLSYENTEATYLAMIFNAESFTDFLIGLDYASSILEYDSRVLAEYNSKKADLETAKAQQVANKEEQDALLVSLAADKAELEEEYSKCENLIETLNLSLSEAEKLEEKYEEEKEAEAKELDKFIEELEKKKGQTQNVAEGEFMWPVPVSVKRISSGFGNRKDPFTGKASYHSGIDIPGAAGTKIFASNNGTVIKVVNDATESTYGKYVMIDHGGGVYTLYAHCRKLLVKEGQYVTKGTQIAEMGTTGRSTGNHLHFEVREGKNRVNPLNYVKKPS